MEANLKIKNIKEVRNVVLPKEQLIRSVETQTGDTYRYIEGYASVFNQPSKLLVECEAGEMRMFNEIIEQGAFDEVLASSDLDCVYNVDHDNERMISRTKAGTLVLSVDEYGLKFRAKIAKTGAGNDLIEHVSLGNISENSFCFSVEEERWDESTPIPTRYISKVGGLYDVSSVINPAYNGTRLSLRGLEVLKTTKQEQKKENNEYDLIELEVWLAQNK